MKVLDHDGTDHLIDKIYDLVNSGGSADYIVEEGTSGIWTYRKWASGIAECWGTQTETKASYVTLGNNWYGYYTSNVSLPFNFLQTPNVNASMKVASNLTVASPLINVSTTNVCSYGMAYGVSSSSTITVNYQVKGLWKEFTPSVSRFDSSTKIYTPTLASGIGVRSWGSCFVAKIGKIHILNFWGLYSSSAITSDTLILTLESGKKFAGTSGSFSTGSDSAILRIEANNNKIFANSILADTSYYGQAVFVEL